MPNEVRHVLECLQRIVRFDRNDEHVGAAHLGRVPHRPQVLGHHVLSANARDLQTVGLDRPHVIVLAPDQGDVLPLLREISAEQAPECAGAQYRNVHARGPFRSLRAMRWPRRDCRLDHSELLESILQHLPVRVRNSWIGGSVRPPRQSDRFVPRFQPGN